jgi:hypothetical protein
MIVEPHSYSVTNLCNVRMLNFPPCLVLKIVYNGNCLLIVGNSSLSVDEVGSHAIPWPVSCSYNAFPTLSCILIIHRYFIFNLKQVKTKLEQSPNLIILFSNLELEIFPVTMGDCQFSSDRGFRVKRTASSPLYYYSKG